MVQLSPGVVYPVSILRRTEIEFISQPVTCGFPSPAQDYLQLPIDLNEILIGNPTATFLFVAEGSSMSRAHIVDGCLLVIDRSITPQDKHIVLADLDGEFTVKTLDKKLMRLMPANPSFQPLVLNEGQQLKIWGVITNIIINPYKSYVRFS